jgi:hypothetical protein
LPKSTRAVEQARFENGDGRQEAWLTLTVGALGWLLIFSLSPSKADHYVYPAYPFVALAIAGMLAEVWSMLPPRLSAPRIAWPVMATLLLAFGAHSVHLLTQRIPAEVNRSALASLYHAHKTSTHGTTNDVLLIDLPASHVEWRERFSLSPGDCFYLEQLLAGHRRISRDALPGTLASVDTALLIAPADPALADVLRSLGLRKPIADHPTIGVWHMPARSTAALP